MKATLLILTMGGLLAAAAGVALYTWDQLSDVTMSTDGIVAMVLGVVASLALGMGLMALIFYSHRKGHDHAAGARFPAENRDLAAVERDGAELGADPGDR